MYLSKYYSGIYKGLAILFIMLCHAAGTFFNGSVVLFTPLGGIGVAIFLLLSAYGLNESWKAGGGTAWWRKRFIAVWIPYIIIQLIAYWPVHKFELIPFLLDLSLIKPLYQNGWYLNYLFVWYVIFFLLRRIKLIDNYRVVTFGVISIILFALFNNVSPIRAEQSLSFWAGIVLSEKKELQEKLFKIRYGFAFVIIGIAFLAIKQIPFIRAASNLVMNTVQLGIKLPIGLGMIILCCSVIPKYKWLGVMLGWIGMISYELYIIHGYVLQSVPISVTGAVIFVSGSVLLSFACWWILNKIKPMWYKVLRIA